MFEVGGRHFKILACVVKGTEYSAIQGALPLVKINNPYRKAYFTGCQPKNLAGKTHEKILENGFQTVYLARDRKLPRPVSYTHLTLPTICSV